LQRQALHAKTLAFDHPITNERLKFSSNLPNDFKLCIDKWRAYSKYTK
jgi:23S rRNA pseudouridine1911/1915/1917 synthase